MDLDGPKPERFGQGTELDKLTLGLSNFIQSTDSNQLTFTKCEHLQCAQTASIVKRT
jgi:hypothetical protein